MEKYKVLTSRDGTIRIDFSKGYSSVIIPAIGDKYTVCVSSQIGCPIKCKFCHTAKFGFSRNLSSEEILNQVSVAVSIIKKDRPHSVVFMGMGEPSLNLSEVLRAIELIHDQFSVSYKRITVSTSAFDNISSFLGRKFNVAISLHSPFDSVRKELISPKTISLRKILNFSKKYSNESRKKYIMIEYAFISGVNDREKDLKKLLTLKWPKKTLFNLLEFNDIGNFHASKLERIQHFKLKLIEKGYKCFIRMSRGKDIGAACGMLNLE